MPKYDGSIRIDSRIDTKPADKGLAQLSSSLKGFASAVGVAFGIGAIVSFGKAAVQASSDLSNAMTGLQSIAEGSGRSFAQANKFIQEYISDGLVPATNAVTAYKNLLSRGYDTEQIENIMTRLKDAAAFGRQASYSLGDAVQSASEGLRQENSLLVDNAGVTRNVAKMWQDYAKTIGVSVNNLTQAQKRQAEYLGIMEETRFQVGDAAKITETYSGQVSSLAFSFNNLKVALGNAIIPVLQAILPHINAAIQGLTIFANKLAQMTGGIFGKANLGGTAAAADGAAKSVDGMTDSIAASGAAAKKAGKGLAAFDELLTLADDSASGASGAGGGVIDALPEVTLGGEDVDYAAEIENKLSEITLVISGALLALGAILFFSGTKPLLGLGLMAAGAIGLATEIYANWDTVKTLMQGPLGQVVTVLSGSLLALGAVLAFSGAALPLGIGLMVAGAAGLAATAALNWDSIKNKLDKPIGDIAGVLGGALLVLGAAIAFSGAALPLGIGLMVAGAAGLATSAVLNWDKVKTAMQGEVGKITAMVSAAALALGALFVFSGAGIGLGLGLMAAGAVGLAATAAFNWSTITSALNGPIGGITALVGGALLALGAVLFFTGAGIPLGLGLMIAGGAALGTAIAVNWDAIPDKLAEVWSAISIGVKDFANGFIGTIEGMVNKVISGINWMIEQLNKVSFDIPDWVPAIGGKSFGFNIPSLSDVKIPRLAEGAVIPPNREFMAILGDQKRGVNIETPLETMIEAFKTALAEMGGNGQEINLTVNLDGEVVYRNQQNIAARYGRNIMPGVT